MVAGANPAASHYAHLQHLFSRLGLIEAAVRATVAERRVDDPNADDPFRGLYVSDEHVERLLGDREQAIVIPIGATERSAEIERRADAAEAAGADLRLRRLARAFGLSDADVSLLLVALAPDLDARFEKLYGYLNDDVTRRRATIGLALELAGLATTDAAVRGRLVSGAPLFDGGLLVIEDADRPFLTRSLRVPDRVAAHLLGSDDPDPELTHLYVDLTGLPTSGNATADAIARAVAAGARLIHLHDRPGAATRVGAVGALAACGRGAVVLDLGRLQPEDDIPTLASIAVREATLLGAGLVAGPLEVLTADTGGIEGRPAKTRGAGAVRAFAEAGRSFDCPVVLISRGPWDPAWSRSVPVLADAPIPVAHERDAAWTTALAATSGVDPALDAAEATAHFRMAPEQVARAGIAAGHQAALDGVPLGVVQLRAGARAQNAAGLEHLARRTDPAVGWSDLILPPLAMSHLHELAARARNREQVLDMWRMRPGGGRGRGIAALFAGDSGTGKTMSAEVLAYELGLDLYTVNLATVVDKYVGETEKNLERIFSEADGINGVLFFDEADALFGKRSEVKDAHDRYANIETAYLLQRMESFDGVAILSTNLRANLDDAFARRLDSIIDFPMPDAEHREHLWDRCLGRQLPRSEDVDLGFLAQNFELSGGNIRSIALTAAYLAAETTHEVTMTDLVKATAREYRKLGRLIVTNEFGPYMSLVKAD